MQLLSGLLTEWFFCYETGSAAAAKVVEITRQEKLCDIVRLMRQGMDQFAGKQYRAADVVRTIYCSDFHRKFLCFCLKICCSFSMRKGWPCPG